MERLLVLRLEALACVAEAWMNGICLARVDARCGVRTLPVHEFTLAGANQLELVVQPGPPGTPLPVEPRIADGKSVAGLKLMLPRDGQRAHPSHARVLAQIDWGPPQHEIYEAPLRLPVDVELPIDFPRWRWLDAPVIAEPAAARTLVLKLLQQLALGLARGDPEPFVTAARLRFEELALAYQRKPADEVGRWRLQIKDQAAKGPWQPDLAVLTQLRLRPVAGGRLLECLAEDGEPVLRGCSADGSTWFWPLRVAMIEGRAHVLR